MKLERLTASFGRLNGETLELGGGLNIVEAANESGKTTWCAFIRAILYGIDTSVRDKAGFLSDKTKYRPWSGAPMEGSARLTSAGRDITIQRTGTARYPMRDFKAVYTGTGEPVTGLTGQNAGETLTGVTLPVFERSAFIGQSAIRVAQTPELEKRISALVSTGDETTSYTQAAATLAAWQRKRRYRQSGAIPALETKLREAEAALAEMERIAGETAAVNAELEKTSAAAERLRAELSAHDARRSADAAKRAAAARTAADGAAARLAALRERLAAIGSPTREELTALRGGLAAYYSAGALLETERIQLAAAERAYASARAEAESSPVFGLDAEKCRGIAAGASGGKKASWLMAVLIVVAAAAAVGAAAASGALRYALGAVTLASGIALIVNAVKALSASKALTALLKKAGAETVGELETLLNEGERLGRELETATARLESARQAEQSAKGLRAGAEADFLKSAASISGGAETAEAAQRALNGAEQLFNETERAEADAEGAARVCKALAAEAAERETAPDLPEPTMDRETAQRALAEAEARLERLKETGDIARGRSLAIGDPLVIGGEIGAARERIAELTAQYDALGLAMTELAAASEELSTRFSPVLARRAGEIMTRLTGGRYDRLTFDSRLEASLRQSGDGVSRSALSVSEGAADQIYLALRLAVTELALPSEDPCPLILDDALASFDDRRMELALELLAELADERQVVLFTCHSREARYMSGRARVTGIN